MHVLTARLLAGWLDGRRLTAACGGSRHDPDHRRYHERVGEFVRKGQGMVRKTMRDDGHGSLITLGISLMSLSFPYSSSSTYQEESQRQRRARLRGAIIGRTCIKEDHTAPCHRAHHMR